MKISNMEVQYLYNWLNVPLHGEQSRSRTKFVSIIRDQYNNSLDGRTEILKDLADKDDKGQAIIENGTYKMSEDKLATGKETMSKFLDKTVTYKIPKGTKNMIKNVIAILNETKGLDIATGEIHDAVLTTLEEIK